MLSFVKRFDFLLLSTSLILCVFGFIALYSIGLGKEPVNFAYLERQGIVFGIFGFIAIVIAVINYRVFASYSVLLYIVSCLILIAVLVFGREVRGTKGWMYLGSVGFQPAELAKIALILMLSRYFSRVTRQVGHVRHLLITGLIAAVPIGLVMLQPDFGSAAILAALWLGMIIISGVPKKSLVALALIFATLAVGAWLFLFKDYQKQRIMTFISPTADQKGSGYNVRQALIAVGSGQIMGRGLGLGSQSHLKFLPEAQTDFIFSVISEEMGFVGVSVIFICWFLFFHRLSILARNARDDFTLYIVLGISIMFFVHVVLNIGGNLGMIPLTGIALPFLSYGGSSLALSLISLGLLQSIRVHQAA